MEKIVQLVSLREEFDKFRDEDVSTFIKVLLDHNKRDTILSGIFRQLYREGDKNSDNLLMLLLTEAKSVNTNAQNTKGKANIKNNSNNEIDNMPDSLLSKIGSYLPSKNIFSKWTRVNRKFVKTAYKPETIVNWNFVDCDTISSQLKQFAPKFRLTCTVSRLNFVKYNRDYSNLFNIFDVKSLTHLLLGLLTLFSINC